MKKKITEVVNDDSSETIFYMNQSDLSRHIGPGGGDGHSSKAEIMNNRRVNRSTTSNKNQLNKN